MGEGSTLRVLFGRQPSASPMRGRGSLAVLVVLAGVTAGLTVAGHSAMGLL